MFFILNRFKLTALSKELGKNYFLCWAYPVRFVFCGVHVTCESRAKAWRACVLSDDATKAIMKKEGRLKMCLPSLSSTPEGITVEEATVSEFTES